MSPFNYCTPSSPVVWTTMPVTERLNTRKMTIDMEEPFIWPELPRSLWWKVPRVCESDQTEAMAMLIAQGSNKHSLARHLDLLI